VYNRVNPAIADSPLYLQLAMSAFGNARNVMLAGANVIWPERFALAVANTVQQPKSVILLHTLIEFQPLTVTRGYPTEPKHNYRDVE